MMGYKNENFENFRNFKSFFPENNYKQINENLNERKEKERLNLHKVTKRKKLQDLKLAKYTFYVDQLRNKMPEEMKKKRRSISKNDKAKASKNEAELHIELGKMRGKEKTSQSKSFFSRKSFFKNTQILRKEQKFSDVVKNILKNPSLQKVIKKPEKKLKFFG